METDMRDHDNNHVNIMEPPQMENNFDNHPTEPHQQPHVEHHEMPPMYHNPHTLSHVQPHQTPADIFSDLDKTAYIVMFVAFILGFFMGKTMNPVIIRGHI